MEKMKKKKGKIQHITSCHDIGTSANAGCGEDECKHTLDMVRLSDSESAWASSRNQKAQWAEFSVVQTNPHSLT